VEPEYVPTVQALEKYWNLAVFQEIILANLALPMSRYLFIKLKHIGDLLLLTPTLNALRNQQPECVIEVLVRKGTEEILQGCPAVDRIWTTTPVERSKRNPYELLKNTRLIRQLRDNVYDTIFEMGGNDRGRFIALLLKSQKRISLDEFGRTSKIWKLGMSLYCPSRSTYIHQVEKSYLLTRSFLELPEVIPELSYQVDETVGVPAAPCPKPFIVIHPGTRWVRKQWPINKWKILGGLLIKNGYNLVVSCGPDQREVDEADYLVKELGESCVSTQGQYRWIDLAACLKQAILFCGVDTAAMHLSSACNCPTVALFGPSLPLAWKPWNQKHKIVSFPSDYLPEHHPNYFSEIVQRETAEIPVEDVFNACINLLKLGA
jgi:heptosyltransferase III